MKQPPLRTNYSLRFTQLLLQFYKICGIAPFSVRIDAPNGDKSSKTLIFSYSNLEVAYNFILTCGLLGAGVVTMPMIFEMNAMRSDFIKRVIESIQSASGLFCVCAIILTRSFDQKCALRIANNLLEVDRSFLKYDTVAMRTTYCFDLVLFLLHFVLWVFIIIIEYISFEHNLIVWLSSIFPIFFVYVLFTQYGMVMTVVKRRFQMMNRILARLAAVEECDDVSVVFSRHILGGNPTVVQLKTLKYVYHTLCVICEDLETFYSLPALLGVGFYFIIEVYNAYYLVVPYVGVPQEESVLLSTLTCLLWIVILTNPMVILSFNVSMVIKEAKKTGQIVHKLLGRTLKREIVSELKEFSLQLLHNDVQFSAYGIFSLDLTLLHSIMNSAATYLVILIQFSPNSTDNRKE